MTYDLKLNLPRGDLYSGCIEITFSVSEQLPERPLYIDFRGYAIDQYTVNESKIDAA